MYRPESSSEKGGGTAFLGTLSNGLRALEVLADGRHTLRELAAALDLPRQTTYRIVHTLHVMGWVERHESDDTYGLSVRMWAIGVRSHESTDLQAQWSDTIKRLSDDIGETVHLAVYDNGWSVYIGKRDGWHPIRSYSKLGGRSPAYCVATGKVLLAAQPNHEIDRVVNGELESYTPNTIATAGKLREELERTHRRGYAINCGEYREEVGGIAVPLRSPLGEVVAALGFSGPRERIEGRFEELLRRLEEAKSNTHIDPSGDTA